LVAAERMPFRLAVMKRMGQSLAGWVRREWRGGARGSIANGLPAFCQQAVALREIGISIGLLDFGDRSRFFGP